MTDRMYEPGILDASFHVKAYVPTHTSDSTVSISAALTGPFFTERLIQDVEMLQLERGCVAAVYVLAATSPFCISVPWVLFDGMHGPQLATVAEISSYAASLVAHQRTRKVQWYISSCPDGNLHSFDRGQACCLVCRLASRTALGAGPQPQHLRQRGIQALKMVFRTETALKGLIVSFDESGGLVATVNTSDGRVKVFSTDTGALHVDLTKEARTSRDTATQLTCGCWSKARAPGCGCLCSMSAPAV